MAEVVIFHPVLGVRQGVRDAARRLEGAGHVVHVPDLNGGRVFEGDQAGYDAGLALTEHIGSERLSEMAWEAVRDLPKSLVYLGFSMGARRAQELATGRPGAIGAVLLDGGGFDDAREAWPATVPVELHFCVDDPWVDEGAPEALARAAARAGAPSAVYRYPGDNHLFSDASLPDYDAASARLMWKRVLAFLDTIDSAGKE